MAKQAKLRAVLTLDNSAFAKSIKQSIALAKDLAKQFKAQPIRTTFLAGILTARSGIKATAGAIEGIYTGTKKVIGAMFSLKGAVTAALGGLTFGAFIHSSVAAAAKIEDLTVGFKVLLHSETAATDRMKELVNFAAHTPYMLPQVAAASRTLQVLTQGALATGKGLEMVGDIAAATNRDFEETAITVGRLFAALRSGQHPGEALASLQDAGAISPDARRRISGMAGVNPAKAWEIAQQELSRFSGMMEQKSRTWNGLMSTFHDSILNAFAVFGKPLIDTLKPALDQLTQVTFAAAPKIAEMGTQFAAGINLGVSALEESFFHPDKLIGPLVAGLKAGFLEAGNVLIAGVKTAASLVPDIVSSFAGAFVGLQEIISGQLTEAFRGPIAYLQASLEALWARMSGSDSRKQYDQANAEISSLTNQRIALRRKQEHQELYGEDTSGTDAQLTQVGKKLKQAEIKRDQSGVGISVSDRQKQLMSTDDISERARNQIEEGGKVMAKAMKDAMQAIEDAASKFSIDDVTGAGEQMKSFMDALKNLAEKGKADVAKAIVAQQAAQNTGTIQAALAQQKVNQAAANASIRGGLTSGSLAGASISGGDNVSPGQGLFMPNMGNLPAGLHGLNTLTNSSLNAPAQRTVQSMLPLSERRRNARYARIADIAAEFMTHGRFDERRGGAEGFAGSVRRGDRAAARQFIIGKERETAEQAKLDAFAKVFENAFDKGMTKHWGDGTK